MNDETLDVEEEKEEHEEEIGESILEPEPLERESPSKDENGE